jgi:phosphoribosylformimino-5-aminoimidazole carboxamide ribotide isomerase
MRIIPAIDIINGKCVRLTKGDYFTIKVYNENPLEVAKVFENAGIKYLHLVDLDGAAANHIVNYKVLENIAKNTSLKIDFGGGIKSDEDLKVAFESGASQVVVGSVAYKNKELFLKWLEMYGDEKIVLGADAKDRKIATQGWLQTSNEDIIEFIAHYNKKGVKYVICTDINKDGMLQGASIELYQEILQKINVKLIASGGITSIDDLKKLKEISCEGAIIGKAIYEGKININDLKNIC